MFVLAAKRLDWERKLLILELLGRRDVHHDLDGVHELAHRLVELLVVGGLEFLVDSADRDVDERLLVEESQHDRRLEDGRHASDHDAGRLGNDQQILGSGEVEGLAVDLHLGVLDVGVDPAYALDQLFPRHAVREVEAGSDPARFFGETCQQHGESFASLRMSVWSASYQSGWLAQHEGIAQRAASIAAFAVFRSTPVRSL